MPKILAVDDMAQIVRLIEINLTRHGYDVVTASDGEEAMEKVKSEKPDLIVCDVMMPRKDGISVLRDLKSDPSTRRIPFIMLTVRAQDGDIHEAGASGADAYLFKPFNPQELLETIERLLDASTGSAANI